MMRRRRYPILWLVCGVSVGLAAGVVAMQFAPRDTLPGWLSELPVRATATHGQDNFALATGEIDDGVEALYFLDFLTGELKAAVLNPRTRKFTAFFTYAAVMTDLGIKDVKNPRYLITTGATDMRPGNNPALQLGKGVIYVTEINSGKIAAYAIPWIKTKFQAGAVQQGNLMPLDVVPSRNVAIRPTN